MANKGNNLSGVLLFRPGKTSVSDIQPPDKQLLLRKHCFERISCPIEHTMSVHDGTICILILRHRLRAARARVFVHLSQKAASRDHHKFWIECVVPSYTFLQMSVSSTDCDPSQTVESFFFAVMFYMCVGEF